MIETTSRNFGVEQEHFVFHGDGSPPTHAEIDELWSSLCLKGFKTRGVDDNGRVLSIDRETPWGTLVLMNDSCTHIVEAAFPKMNSLQDFRELYSYTWGQVSEHLAKLGLAIQPGGALAKAPLEVFWRPKETDHQSVRLYTLVNRPPLPDPLFNPSFPACFAATHVSLDIPQEEAIVRLPHYYAHEYLVPLYFSNSPEFQGVKAHCVRPLAWIANFHKPYPLLGVPDRIPATLEEYDSLRKQCSGRDYSFVAIRSESRLEFRSACSQNTVDEVMRLIRFRLEVDCFAEPFNTELPNKQVDSSQAMFQHACFGELAESCRDSWQHSISKLPHTLQTALAK